MALERCSALEEQLTVSHKEVRISPVPFLLIIVTLLHVTCCHWCVVAGVSEGSESEEDDC